MFESEVAAEKAIMTLLASDLVKSDELIEQALKQYPNAINLLYLKASVSVEQNNLDIATEHFVKVIELAPNFDIARFQFAFLAVTQGQYDSALSHFQYLAQSTEVVYLKHFSDGFLSLLANNDEAAASAYLLTGIKSNNENAALNQNMEKVIALLTTENSAQVNADVSEELDTEPTQDLTHGLSNGALLNLYNKGE